MKVFKTRRIIALLLSIVMIFSLLPITSFATDNVKTAYVILENTTFSKEAGAAWDGRLLDMYPVELKDGDKIMDVTLRAMAENVITQEGAENNYISKINGLAAFDGGSMSGWMITLNDWFTNYGAGSFYASDGDVIRWMYTSNGYGEDLGGSWGNNNQQLSNLMFSAGDLNTEFNGENYTYTLNVPSDVDSIKVTPTAANKNYQTRIYKNATILGDDSSGYSISGESDFEKMLSGLDSWTTLPTTLEYYKRTQDIPVINGDIITVACGLPGWNTMNGNSGSGKVYTINIVKEAPQTNYDVTVKVAPSTANANFYNCNGFDADGYDIVGSPVSATDGGVIENYHTYTMKLPKGTYSYRGTDADGNSLGGMTFDIPAEVNVDGTDGGACEIVIRQTELYTTTNNATADEYSTKVIDADGGVATVGSSYLSDHYTRYRYLLYAGGNAELYTYQLIPSEAYATSNNFGVNTLINQTVGIGTTVLTASGTLPTVINAVITAPNGADVKAFNQVKNFYTQEVKATSEIDNGDGTKNCLFRLPQGNANHTYRVSMPNKITRAGYLDLSNAEKAATVITFEENEDPKSTANITQNANLSPRLENSTLLNVNSYNDISLGINENYRLRAYRAAWQIINSDVANIMVEPDFNYSVISGGEHISITPVTKINGNAKNNWLDIKGISNGVAVLEISYDALVVGGNTTYNGTYGATESERTSLVVVQVGRQSPSIVITAKGSQNPWDTEYDTAYFTADTGSLTFTATADTASPDKVELSTDKGATWTEIQVSNSEYTANNLVSGNNILRFTKDGKEAYQVVRAKKTTADLKNITMPNESVVLTGNTVDIHFNELNTPIAKFAGIYNPGFMTGHKITYNLPEGAELVKATGGQYSFINDHIYQVKFTKAGTYTLSGGYIAFNVMGVADPLGGHRLLTDAGVGANFNAVSTQHTRTKLPDITITVIDSPMIPVSFSKNANVKVYNSIGEIVNIDEQTGKYMLAYGDYTYEASADGYITARESFTVGSADGNEKNIIVNLRKIDEFTWDGETATPVVPKNGIYEINTGNELYWFAQQVNSGEGANWNAVLTNDISLGANPWTPIGNSSKKFSGTFDGKGYKISDLYINSTSTHQGLFGYLNTNGVIKNISVDGSVTTTGNYAAGIVAYMAGNSTVEKCSNFAQINGKQNVGGIAGFMTMNTAQIISSYNIGNVKATSKLAGGIAGGSTVVSFAVAISNCYNTGNVSVPTNGGAITGSTSATKVINCYYLSGSFSGTSKAGTEKSEEELKNIASALGMPFVPDTEGINNGYPVIEYRYVDIDSLNDNFNISALVDNKLKTIELTVDAKTSKTLYVYTVAYKNNMLVKTQITPIALAEGNNKCSVINYKDVTLLDNDIIKMFIWDESISPYTQVVEIE